MVTAAIVVLGLEGGLASAEGGPQDCGPFAPPRRVTDGTGLATQTATGLDVANNAYIASVINERIQVKIIGPSLDADVPVAAAGLAQGDPDFATTSTGITYMSFSQLDESTPGDGREIYLTNNEGGGGKFKTPTKISKNPLDDYAPRLVLDLQGKPQLAWAQSVGQSVGEAAQSRVCYWNASLPAQEPVVAASGDYPHLYVDEADVVHLVYSRDKDLYYNNNRGGAFTNEKRVTTTANDPESAASIGGDPSGNILIAYESRYSLYYVTKPPLAEFRPPVLVDAGGILDPRMRVRSRGQVTIVYAKQGDIYYVVGQSTFLSSPERICAHTEAVESRPSLEIDLAGVTHLSYIRDGEVWYTNNASQPVAEFAAIPTIGEVPLTVKFGDLSSGGIEVWEWDFGDGATSLEQNPAHTYTDPGKYKVKLTVSGSGGTQAIKEKEDFIFVQDPYYTMRIPDQLVIPGQENVWFPVITTRKDKTQGFQIRATYDPNYLIFKGSDFSYAVLPTSKPPDLIVVNTIGTSSLEVGCIYELPEPFDPANQFLPPGQNQAILQFIFDVSSGAPQGAKTQVDLVNNRSVSMILNIFIVNGLSKIPALTGSTVEILVVEPPYPRYFLRGDADNNGTLDLTDAVKILNYLFTGGNPPVCLDAADVNDRGKVDISSAVALLNFLFLGGPPPAVPFPNAGLDPTPDSFPDCL